MLGRLDDVTVLVYIVSRMMYVSTSCTWDSELRRRKKTLLLMMFWDIMDACVCLLLGGFDAWLYA